MNIDKALQERIKMLYKEQNTPIPELDSISSETTLETIELICDKLNISVADFFLDDLFRK